MIPGLHQYSRQERVIYGEPAGPALSLELERIRARRALLVTDPQVRQGEWCAQVIAALSARTAGIFDACRPHSPRPTVLELARVARELGADCLVALGGGSVIDTTKAALIALWSDARDDEALLALRGPELATAPVGTVPSPRMVAVPTTLAAAEYTPNAGITDPALGVKQVWRHEYAVPRAVVLDPAATTGAPLDVFLSTGVKALDHAVETLCSVRPQPHADALAMHAIRLLRDALPRVSRDTTDLEARLQAQVGAWLSIQGPAQGVMVGASHALGHALGAHFAVPHGVTSCVLLASVMRWNERANAPRQLMVAEALGAPGGRAADAIEALVRSLGQPWRLQSVGVRRDQLGELARAALDDRFLATNPRPITSLGDVVEILEGAW